MKVSTQDKSHCMKHACTYPADERCPYCLLIERRKQEVDADGFRIYDDNGDRIGSGRGYGGGQGVSSQGPSSPFD